MANNPNLDGNDGDLDAVEIVVPSAAAASVKETPASSAPSGKRGRPKKTVIINSASAGGEENVASGATTKRRRGRPPSRKIAQVPPVQKTVVDQFSTASIEKQVEKENKRVRRAGPYEDNNLWTT